MPFSIHVPLSLNQWKEPPKKIISDGHGECRSSSLAAISSISKGRFNTDPQSIGGVGRRIQNLQNTFCLEITPLKQSPFMIMKLCIFLSQPKLDSHGFLHSICWDHIVAKDWNRIFTKIFLNKQNKTLIPNDSDWWSNGNHMAIWCMCNAASGFSHLEVPIFLELIFWYKDLEVSSTYLTILRKSLSTSWRQLRAQQHNRQFSEVPKNYSFEDLNGNYTPWN